MQRKSDVGGTERREREHERTKAEGVETERGREREGGEEGKREDEDAWRGSKGETGGPCGPHR